jgi:hypothetical protein
MKPCSAITVLKDLQEQCAKHTTDLQYIQQYFPHAIEDIKHVRLDVAHRLLVVGVSPSVWTWAIQEVLLSHIDDINKHFNIVIQDVKVRFMVT